MTDVTKNISLDRSICSERMCEYISNVSFSCECTHQIEPEVDGKLKVLITGNGKLVDKIIKVIGKTVIVGVDNIDIPERKVNHQAVKSIKLGRKFGYQKKEEIVNEL